jgi:hypothetical protein
VGCDVNEREYSWVEIWSRLNQYQYQDSMIWELKGGIKISISSDLNSV